MSGAQHWETVPGHFGAGCTFRLSHIKNGSAWKCLDRQRMSHVVDTTCAMMLVSRALKLPTGPNVQAICITLPERFPTATQYLSWRRITADVDIFTHSNSSHFQSGSGRECNSPSWHSVMSVGIPFTKV